MAYEQEERNDRIPPLLAACFPFTSPESLKFYLRIKTTDPNRLCLAIDEFLAQLNTMAHEGLIPADLYEEIFCRTPIQVNSFKDSCVLIIDMVGSEPSMALEELIRGVYSSVGQIGPYATAELSLGASFKDVVAKVALSLSRLAERILHHSTTTTNCLQTLAWQSCCSTDLPSASKER